MHIVFNAHSMHVAYQNHHHPQTYTQVVLWGGLGLFLAVVAYIVQKRVLFFMPSALSMGFFGATAKVEGGGVGARGGGFATNTRHIASHTRDPPPAPAATGYGVIVHVGLWVVCGRVVDVMCTCAQHVTMFLKTYAS